MSLNNFIPAIWSGRILLTLDNALVYNQEAVVNRDYEGEIAEMGDRVKINSIGRPTVKSYAKNTDIDDPEQLTSAQQELIIDQADYFNFQVDDVDRVQTMPDVMDQAMQDSAYELAAAADTFTAELMRDAIGNANKIGTVGSPKTDLGTSGKAYEYLTKLATLLDESNTPDEGRWAIIPPWFHERLLLDGTYIVNATETGQDIRRNRMVGMVAGFTLYKSNKVPSTDTTTAFRIIAGHRIATSFANQIVETESGRMEKRFADYVRGLNVYGAKVTRPGNLAMLIANRPS